MANDDNPERRINRLVTKIGKVAAAVAALLAENPTNARENDLVSSVLDRTQAAAAVSPRREESTHRTPPPLVLRPSPADTKWMLAGHRSHSSHRSHVSGAMHSSHYSSSPRINFGSSVIPPDSTPSSPDSSSSRPPTRYAPSRRTKPAPAPRVEPAVPVDLTDPAFRYKLLTITNHGESQKAFIKDLMYGTSKLIKVGEKVGDCQLVALSYAEMWARVKTPQGREITIIRNRPATPQTGAP